MTTGNSGIRRALNTDSRIATTALAISRTISKVSSCRCRARVCSSTVSTPTPAMTSVSMTKASPEDPWRHAAHAKTAHMHSSEPKTSGCCWAWRDRVASGLPCAARPASQASSIR